MKSFALLLVLPAIAYGAIIFGGADTAKRCGEALVNGTVKDNVPDPDDCSQYYVCSKWFQSKMKCKSGKHFSATEKKCLDPCDAACDTSLVCTTTAEPETTEATTPGSSSVAESVSAGSSEVDASSTGAPSIVTSESGDKASESTVGAATNGSSQSDATDAPSTATDAASDPTDVPDTTTGASVSSEAATSEQAPRSPESQTEVSAETSTAFWQTIAKHFKQPPTTIPGFSRSVPE